MVEVVKGTVIVFEILGSLGGITAFCGAIWVIVRALIRQSDTTAANTAAITKLTLTMDRFDTRLNQHDIDLAYLKGRDAK